jgi:hypothetical protein
VSLSTLVACYQEFHHLEETKKKKNIVLLGWRWDSVYSVAFMKGREARLPSN